MSLNLIRIPFLGGLVILLAVSLGPLGCNNDDGGHDDGQDHSLCEPHLLDAVPSIFYSVRGEPPARVFVTERGGKLFYQDDILIGSSDAVFPDAYIDGGHLWTDGNIYYEFDAGFPGTDRVDEAFRVWNQGTNGAVRFVARTDQPNYVLIQAKEQACWAHMGMNGGQQQINLGTFCGVSETIHEVGHSIGLIHEQCRPDRDSFVKVLWCNIEADKRYNFMITPAGTSFGPYDYGSIMHYAHDDFSIGVDKSTIISRTDTIVPGKHQKSPSKNDFASVRCLYTQTGCR